MIYINGTKNNEECYAKLKKKKKKILVCNISKPNTNDAS